MFDIFPDSNPGPQWWEAVAWTTEPPKPYVTLAPVFERRTECENNISIIFSLKVSITQFIC